MKSRGKMKEGKIGGRKEEKKGTFLGFAECIIDSRQNSGTSGKYIGFLCRSSWGSLISKPGQPVVE